MHHWKAFKQQNASVCFVRKAQTLSFSAANGSFNINFGLLYLLSSMSGRVKFNVGKLWPGEEPLTLCLATATVVNALWKGITCFCKQFIRSPDCKTASMLKQQLQYYMCTVAQLANLDMSFFLRAERSRTKPHALFQILVQAFQEWYDRGWIFSLCPGSRFAELNTQVVLYCSLSPLDKCYLASKTNTRILLWAY